MKVHEALLYHCALIKMPHTVHSVQYTLRKFVVLQFLAVRYYIFTVWKEVINSMEQSSLEKLTASQLVNKFPAFYGTRSSITAFTGNLHLYAP